MSQSNAQNPRWEAIRAVLARRPLPVDAPRDESDRPMRISEYFGMNTFNVAQMKAHLPKEAYAQWISTLREGTPLDRNVAKAIALSMKEWALAQGAQYFCHWFQPQTGATAEKHDAFLSFDDNNQPIESLSGSQLIQSEPDASSFPSGGMRTTFEARGYTAWDPSSPAFIMESGGVKTLCIPSVFISYHGDALDEKTGLLRSTEALSARAVELLKLIGDTDVERVITTLGTEQEYFLVDRAFASLRPDLVMTGRTLIGEQPPRGQQLEDHYFGSIPSRVQAFMAEMELELHKLGVPLKTRHNEVAPSQFEVAPIFEEAVLAVDHNQLTMEVIRRVAHKHGFKALLHEKPFAGLNGSGKHNNWSMSVLSKSAALNGTNLLEPGKTPHQNLRFLIFLAAVLKGVNKHAGLLRAGIASSGNDHRLGANEAPPAIISVFLGDTLSKICDAIAKGELSKYAAEEGLIKLGVNKLPEVLKDNTDRNRTSPFAFTGNKFEFRAVGSSASPSLPITLLNAAVADGIAEINERIKAKKPNAKNIEQAAMEVIKDAIIETQRIRYEANNYSEEWVKEAASRGLPNLRKTPEALEELISPSSKSALTGLGVFSEAEISARYHVHIEGYVKRLRIEVDTLKQIVDTQITPACFAYYNQLALTLNNVKTFTGSVKGGVFPVFAKMAEKLEELEVKRKILEEVHSKALASSDHKAQAKALAYEVSEAMTSLRSTVDSLEGLVGDEYWPLPKYREMLFLL